MNDIERAILELGVQMGHEDRVITDVSCDLAISALEKQIPKKPLEQRYVNYEIENELIGHCPSCRLKWDVAYWQRYCSNCGQKLDWSWKND